MKPLGLFYDGGRGAQLAPASLGHGELELRALFSGVSRGTERLVWRGDVPVAEHTRMRGPHQEGAFPGPVKYGYAMVAEDERGTPGFVLHPHQDHFRVERSAFHPLPKGLPPGRAVLTPNVETALNAVWDARIAPGDRVAVVGAGVVGCLVAWLAAQIPGTRVTLVDVLPERAFIAETLGCRFALPADVEADQDVVVHTSATSAGLATALGCAGVEAMVVELSWYGEQEVRAPLGAGFHPGRLTLRSSQVGRIPPDRAPRWTYARRLSVALRLLQDDRLDALIDSEGTFESLPDDLPDVFGTPTLCHRVRYAVDPKRR